MSALVIENRRRCGRVCSNLCHTSTGVRSATSFVSVAGYPYPGERGRAGWFCQNCRNAIEKHWEGALKNVPIGDPEPDVCGCGCGERVSRGAGWVAGHQAVMWRKDQGVTPDSLKRARIAANIDARKVAA